VKRENEIKPDPNGLLRCLGMGNEVCKCGHLKSEHLDFINRLDKQKNVPYKEYVDMGFGKCKKCDCAYFKK
jgi:hypothetical protein